MANKDSYVVTHALNRDGQEYEAGETIALTEEEAEELKALDPPAVRDPEVIAESPAAAERVEALEEERKRLSERVAELEDAGDVLLAMTVDEQEEAIAEIENIHRLKGVREEESRKSALSNLNSRIDELEEDEEE